jgi:uncharacterized protein YhfF
MDHSPEIAAFWHGFLKALPETTPAPELTDVWRFGDSEALANELLALVLVGTKTATAGLLAAFEHDKTPVPRPGDLSIVTDGTGNPAYIHETTEVRVLEFLEVDAAFAFDEGEGDRSLGFWRDAHRRFFGRECQRIGLTFTDDMLVVCERFCVRHRV